MSNNGTVDVRVTLRGGFDKPVVEAISGGEVFFTHSFDPYDADHRFRFFAGMARLRPEYGGPEDLVKRFDRLLVDRHEAEAEKELGEGVEQDAPVPIGEIIDASPNLRDSVVHGLLRRGETGNIIAAPKVGKSWMAYLLALCIVLGRDWLERFHCPKGRVLLIDNELHRQTIGHRIPQVADAMGVKAKQYRDGLEVLSLRGRLKDLHGIARDLERIEPGEFDLVILDTWYRALPAGTSENDNAQVMALYNLIDSLTERLDCGWMNIHHASKGAQGGKEITDVGAGAGSQSRAADAHIVLRQHETPGCAVMEAVVRSFAPPEPVPLRWEFPLWWPDQTIDPAAVKGAKPPQEQRQRERDQQGIDLIVSDLRKGPKTKRAMRSLMGTGRLERLLAVLEREGVVASQAVEVHGNASTEYSLKE